MFLKEEKSEDTGQSLTAFQLRLNLYWTLMPTDWSQMGVISRQKMGLEGGGGLNRLPVSNMFTFHPGLIKICKTDQYEE